MVQAGRGCYALDPDGGRGGPDTRDGARTPVEYDPVAKTWTVPFIMASVNSPVVRKSNALLGYAYGEQCSYSEVSASASLFEACLSVAAFALGGLAMLFPPSRYLLVRFALPKPGQGPSKEARDEGYFSSRVFAVGERGSDGDRPVVVSTVSSPRGAGTGVCVCVCVCV